jgi:hypothetical protein
MHEAIFSVHTKGACGGERGLGLRYRIRIPRKHLRIGMNRARKKSAFYPNRNGLYPRWQVPQMKEIVVGSSEASAALFMGLDLEVIGCLFHTISRRQGMVL